MVSALKREDQEVEAIKPYEDGRKASLADGRLSESSRLKKEKESQSVGTQSIQCSVMQQKSRLQR